MKINKALIVSSVLSLMMASGLAQAGHRGHHHGHHEHESCCHHSAKKLPMCCSTVRERCEASENDYAAGCKAAKSYVQGEIGGSKSWNEGFSDCRFNIYRSCEVERQMEKLAEKSACGSSDCSP